MTELLYQIKNETAIFKGHQNQLWKRKVLYEDEWTFLWKNQAWFWEFWKNRYRTVNFITPHSLKAALEVTTGDESGKFKVIVPKGEDINKDISEVIKKPVSKPRPKGNGNERGRPRQRENQYNPASVAQPRPPVPPVQSAPGVRYRVKFDFLNPTQEIMLRLRTGDIIDFIKDEDINWGRGRLNGTEGIFPYSYVERI